MFCTVYSGGLCGVSAYIVQVEVDISTGLPGFGMVGSLGGEVREAKERVQVALRNAGFCLPPMKVTVNLAPANVRKEGTIYDLPIAVGMLTAIGQLGRNSLEGLFLAGELGLDGEIKPVRGIFPMIREAMAAGIRCCLVPTGNVAEGALVRGMDVRGAENIGQVVRFLKEKGAKRDQIIPREPYSVTAEISYEEGEPDFEDVCGQEGPKRAAEIAAAGFHSLLMIGAPGAGKSMIAKRIPGILPPLSEAESMEVSAVYSVAGRLTEKQPLVTKRPFQNPHHTVTKAALIGGGSVPRPGILSLAHRGVLFLDELPEFSVNTMECMRQPLEEHMIYQARAYGNITFPADFMLVCAMNPCGCGFYPDRNRCRCTESAIRKYLGRISGPILDRIDLCVEVLPVDFKGLGKKGNETSETIRKRVMKARKRQKERLEGTGYHFNSAIPSSLLEQYCALDKGLMHLMEQAFRTMHLSVRGYHRILRVARTIADLSGEDKIREEHLLEAICYRTGEQTYWGNRDGNV